jgi:hypothetical protein
VAGRQRIDRVRRQYNQWVANQTLEDTRCASPPERAALVGRPRRQYRAWRDLLPALERSAHHTLNYGATNATAILVVSVIIFSAACRLPTMPPNAASISIC